MGVFSINNMLQENFTSQPVLPLQNSNESFYSMSLEYCKLINEEYDQANKVLYKSLLEAGEDYTVINESFNSFFSKVGEIVAKFIKFLKNLIDKFALKMNQLVKSDKYIKKHEKQFAKFGTDNEFDMQLFNFTFLEDSNIPLANAQTTFREEFQKISAFVSDNANGNNSNSIVGLETNKQVDVLRTAYKTMTDNTDNELDEFRGSVINEKSIDASNYASELYKKFRNKDDSTTLTTVTSSIVNLALLRFKNYDKNIKSVKDTQNKLEDDYNKIVKHVDNMISNKGEVITLIGWSDVTDTTVKGKYTQEVIAELNMISKAVSNKVQQMSSIHLQAMGAKLDAIKAAFKQDKTLLYRALSELQKWNNVKNESSDNIITPVMHISSLLEMANTYDNYRALELHNHRIMNDYFVECMALESHNTQVMEILTEGAFEKIKEFITNIINKIKEFFGKIVESISHAVEKDQTYLKQYKDIILNKKVQLGTLNEYYEFKIQELVQGTPIPEFNYESLKSSLEDEETFRNKYFNKITMKSEQSFGDACKLYFMGEPKDVDAEKLNMTDLYNFCWDFESTKKALERELNKLSTAQGKAIEIADKVSKAAGQNTQTTNTNSTEKPVEKKEESKPEEKNNAPLIQKGNLTPKQKKEANASFVYSSVYGEYISESVILEIGSSNGNDNKKQNKDTVSTNPAPSSSNTASNNMKLTQGTASKDLNNAFQGEKPDEVQRRITVYFNTCNALLTAKITVVKKIYEDYMWIIREHVRSYAGDKDRNNKDHAAKVASITYGTIDENLQKMNQEDLDTYKENETLFKNHFKTINGKFWYSKEGNLNKTGSEKTGNVVNTEDPAAMIKAYEEFISTEDGKKVKEFSDKCKEQYGFTLIPDIDDLKKDYDQPVENEEEQE